MGDHHGPTGNTALCEPWNKGKIVGQKAPFKPKDIWALRARILGHWVDDLGLERADCGTHSMRRTKATLIYRRTKHLRAVQLFNVRAVA